MTDVIDLEFDDFLAHFGVKGMHWGERKSDGPAGVSSKTNREAKKDATEFTKAKLFYGEGAGTRRKLIKAKVDQKKAKDPNYAKAFEHHVGKTDLGKRAEQARSERRRKDVKKSAGKGFRGTRHILNGNSQYASATTAAVVGGAMYIHAKDYDRALLNAGRKFLRDSGYV